ncbi:MAG: hypothetical protein M1819_000168 [Sarea resinae]|nr:MAG: hypothetical protein M1819_000168 [Sarea resinae]
MSEESRPRGSGEFMESAVLDTIVPHASDIKFEDVFTSASSEETGDWDASVLSTIPQRSLLFYDELADVYVVLRTPYLDEATLKSYLSRLSISLEAHVAHLHPPESRSSQHAQQPDHTELIFSAAVSEGDDPLIVVHESGSNGDRHIFVAWKLQVYLSRPRQRIQSPAIYFSASANLRPAEKVDTDVVEEEYLPSQVPAGLNLLESLQDDPVLAGVNPRLSALRVSRVAPATRVAKELLRPLKNKSQRRFRVAPALTSRVRYSRLNTSVSQAVIIASLDFEVTPFAGYDTELKTIEIELPGGYAEALEGPQGTGLPVICQPRDDITFLYKLTPDSSTPGSQSSANLRDLNVSVGASILVSEDCRPRITMRWKAPVDFSMPVNPSFGAPTQLMQRNHRPSSLPVDGAMSGTGAPDKASSQAPGNRASTQSIQSIDSDVSRQRASSTSGLGITLTFSGPETVHVGDPFRWSVFIVNRSNRHRKLGLVPVPRRRKTDFRRHLPRPSSSSGRRKDDSIADAVVDENIVYAMQRNAIMEPAELVSLSTDVRVGPLAPGACHTVELKFLALATGALHVETVRVVDLATQDTTEVYARDLPGVFAVTKE